jgi:hypothetical protein
MWPGAEHLAQGRKSLSVNRKAAGVELASPSFAMVSDSARR